MEMKEFIKTVKEMRLFQRSYFRTRSVSDLQRAKELERQVDKMIQGMNDNPRLF